VLIYEKIILTFSVLTLTLLLAAGFAMTARFTMTVIE
jgi:hypothetical protein